MRIIIACSRNLVEKRKNSIDVLRKVLTDLRHENELLEIGVNPYESNLFIENFEPDIVWNMGVRNDFNDHTFFPALMESLGISYTGNGTSFFSVHNKLNISRAVLSDNGIISSEGVFFTPSELKLAKIPFRKFNVRDNIHFDNSILYTTADLSDSEKIKEEICSKNFDGVIVEKCYIRNFSVCFLDGFHGKILDISERKDDISVQLKDDDEIIARKIRLISRNIIKKINLRDYGIIDFSMDEKGRIYFSKFDVFCDISENSIFGKSLKRNNIEIKDFVRTIIRNVTKRSGIIRNRTKIVLSRDTARTKGIVIGRFQTGKLNSITDIKGIRVGHFTRFEDNVDIPGSRDTSSVRTGVTAIIPAKDIYQRRMIAGGFVLNGVGEMAGLTQVMEWGLLETPILLTNSMSVGKVHDGVVNYMQKIYPDLGVRSDVVLPVVGETDDSFLNDVRVGINRAGDAISAIESAKGGKIQQGSVGAGTGMITCDFAGGIGTSSRIVPLQEGGFTVGVLVLSNFGKMKNLTIDGKVVGRELDREMPEDMRRKVNYGSIIVVVATDAPLNSSQLNRLSKRAALGLGRAGSYAGYTSGEIIIAFSTSNRIPRISGNRFLTIRFVSDEHIDPLYEATVEATEEAIINAIFCSSGMNGRNGRQAPAIDQEKVKNILGINE